MGLIPGPGNFHRPQAEPPPPKKKEKEKEKKKKKTQKIYPGVTVMEQWVTNPTRNQEVVSSIPGLTPWVKDPALP